MNPRSSAGLLLLLSPLWAASATAADLRASAERHAAEYAAQTAAPVAPVAAPKKNPNKKIATILGGVGAGLVILGVVHKSGVECKITDTSFNCGQTVNKPFVVLGLIAGAAGAAMYVVGEGKKASTAIGISPSGVGVQQRIRF